GYAEAAVQTAPVTPTTTTTTKAEPVPSPPANPAAGDRPQERATKAPAAKPKQKPLYRVPPTVHPPLTAGHYVFPVYGPASYIDTDGAVHADVSYHHGDDIFGQLGDPLVACADGTVFSVGFNKVGGNRPRLRDGQGNEFY